MSQKQLLTPEEKVKASLSSTLAHLNTRLLRSEIAGVAAKAGVARNTATAYLLGHVARHEVAIDIINAARSIISCRERSIRKLSRA